MRLHALVRFDLDPSRCTRTKALGLQGRSGQNYQLPVRPSIQARSAGSRCAVARQRGSIATVHSRPGRKLQEPGARYRRSPMTHGEQRMLARGVAAGVLVGLAIGGMIALCIAIRPELFGALVG